MNVWVVRLSECPPWLTLPGIRLFKGTCPVYVCVDDNIVGKALLVPYSQLPLEKSHCSTCDGRCRWRSFTRRRIRRRFSFCGISLPTLSHLTASAVKYNSRVPEYIHLTISLNHPLSPRIIFTAATGTIPPLAIIPLLRHWLFVTINPTRIK